jgi:hypothetical protein
VQKIKYEFINSENKDSLVKSLCITFCPNGILNMVNSKGCHECEYFVDFDKIKKEVYCNYKEVKDGN